MKLSENDLEELGTCIEMIGQPELPSTICDFCMKLCEAESVYLSAFFGSDKPAALYTNHDRAEVQTALEIYNDLAYVVDPFFDYFQKGGQDAVLRLSDIAPDNFKKSEYFNQFYQAMGLRDECGLLVRFSDKAALFLSIGVHQKGDRIRPAKLKSAMPLIASVLKRHWTVLTPERTDNTTRLAAVLESAFDAFGASILSPREGDILRLILKGHSSKSIARIFGNSPETIKVHRRRAYSKLNITSQGELLSLFLDALRYTPLNSQEDPLLHLQDAKSKG
ncbi:Transcriptional regulatory protein TdiR [Roseovarius albus]|uniref:Transcriptional regulatory protein TdiR n=1 Tax=Roseovarius albus TaxID=1247867 RepID=A0A1X6Y6T3_9RHOB|nr:helix-turn-helix transcriptional regulator [Roseovarius albus]SLN12357.1 Transcriptional regulatory protein TdiR [Roseovarius albus]